MLKWLSDHVELDLKDLFVGPEVEDPKDKKKKSTKGDIRKFYDTGHLMWTNPEEAPPFLRKQSLAFISIQDNDGNDIGTFVPELYELAKVNGLKAQQERDLWVAQKPPPRPEDFPAQSFYKVLHHEDGTPKKPFELALLEVIYNDNGVLRKAAKAARKIEERMTNEYLYRLENNQALPPYVPKYQIESDYLKYLGELKYLGKKGCLKAVRPRDVDLNLPNPGAKTKWHEKWLHYLLQRAAFVLTILSALTAAVVTSSVWMGALVGLGVILAEWCGKEFGVFGTAESILRHLPRFAEEFRWGTKLSLKKTLKTAVLLAAIGVATYGVVMVTWVGIMGLPWFTASATGLSAGLLIALQHGIAATASAVAGASTFLGGLDSVDFFWGFNPWHKQVDFSEDYVLPVQQEEKKLKDEIAELLRKVAKNQAKLQALNPANLQEDVLTPTTVVTPSYTTKSVDAKAFNPASTSTDAVNDMSNPAQTVLRAY